MIIIFFYLHPVYAGLVQPRTGVCPGRVLLSLRGERVPSSPQLPEGPDGVLREQLSGRPHPSSLQLRLLCLPRPWKQVNKDMNVQKEIRTLSQFVSHAGWVSGLHF